MKRSIIVAALTALLPLSHAMAADDYANQADKEWRAYIEPLLPLGKRAAKLYPQGKDPQIRQEMFRFMYSELGAGFMSLAYASPKYPDFIPGWGQVLNNNGLINPDAMYSLTPLDDDGVYKISGYRGSVHIVDFQIGDSSMFSAGKLNEKRTFGPSLANYDIDTMHIGTDGAFEFILSAKRPEGYEGDWRQMVPKTNYMVVRQLSYDWLHEVDARLAIERLDMPAAKPRQSAAEIKAALDQVPVWTENWLKMSIGPADMGKTWGSVWGTGNKVVMIDFTKDQGGRATQLYIASQYVINPDQAIILEMAPGKCRYWNLELANELLNTLDSMNRQSSLNGFTGRLDSDGRYRVVISSRDPGVPNWMDNMGLKAGWIWGRLDTCNNNAAPTVKTVNVADVRKYLPEDTPVVTAEERDAALRLRRKGAQLRRRW